MSDHKTHESHAHVHGDGCGHQAIRHGDHTDYLHDGHLHRDHNGHYDECAISATTANKSQCTPAHDCGAHTQGHAHAPGCGHDAVPHDGHTDYLVDGHLHHPHSGHCDDHGTVSLG